MSANAMVRLTPKTIKDLEQCCAELFAEYNAAEQQRKKAKEAWYGTHVYVGNRATGPFGFNYVPGIRANVEDTRKKWSGDEEFKRRERKFMRKPYRLREQAETILKVLEWAAPVRGEARKKREKRLRSASHTVKRTWPLSLLKRA
jgi:hypothetical protein